MPTTDDSLYQQTSPDVRAPLSHVVRDLSRHRLTLVRSLAATAVAYTLIAAAFTFLAPAQKITTLPFRLEFQGSEVLKYPNGVRFSHVEIATTPILRRAFEKCRLARYSTLEEFSRSVFVIESNPEYETYAAEYQARLIDPRLSPLERDRIHKEWTAKSAALSKSAFTINYLTLPESKIPEKELTAALNAVLQEWASFAINEQHVLDYRLEVLSPAILDRTLDTREPLIALSILRSRINRVMLNIDSLTTVPGAVAIRTKKSDRTSLQEIRVRLEEIVRFKIDPLMSALSANGGIDDRLATITFLETQLAHDQSSLKIADRSAQSIRDALALYSLDQRVEEKSDEAQQSAASRSGNEPTTTRPEELTRRELTPTFIDRLVAITNQANGAEYRQSLLDTLRKENAAAIPLRAELAYDQDILGLTRRSPGSGKTTDPATLNAIAAISGEVRFLVVAVNEIYDLLSFNLNPSRQIYSVTGKTTTGTVRTESLARLILVGIVVLLSTFVVASLFCLAREHALRSGHR